MPAGHLKLGREGEEAAWDLLRSRGFTLLERNFRSRLGEVDLICGHQGVIVFVEVKTRGQGSLGSGTDAVGGTKRARIVRAASEYLSALGLWDKPCRFDVVSVVERGGKLLAEHFPDAFQAETGRAGRGGWQPW